MPSILKHAAQVPQMMVELVMIPLACRVVTVVIACIAVICRAVILVASVATQAAAEAHRPVIAVMEIVIVATVTAAIVAVMPAIAAAAIAAVVTVKRIVLMDFAGIITAEGEDDHREKVNTSFTTKTQRTQRNA